MAWYADKNSGETQSLISDIKSKITIPMYFDKIILPARSSYYSDYNGDLEDTRRTLCPLHDEDTPSFYYREETNGYKCFGCGASGDVISLHRAFTENETGEAVTFNDALKFLKKVFIEHGEVEVNTVGTQKELRDPTKFTYMNSLYARAFKAIIADKELNTESKVQLIWEIKSLREFAYEHGNSCVDYIADELRRYCRGGITSTK